MSNVDRENNHHKTNAYTKHTISLFHNCHNTNLIKMAFSTFFSSSPLTSSSSSFPISPPTKICTLERNIQKIVIGSFNSSFLQNGFSLNSFLVNGFSSKSHFSPLANGGGSVYARAATGKTIYDFTVKDIDKNDVPLSKFKGKVLLVVNVASRCGLTSSNYTELSKLYEKYKTQGLEILAFPCNQFGGQEPGSNPEIKNFACTRFKAEYPIFDKVDVNGPFTAPVYQYLKSSSGGFLGDLIKWNFEKFLLDKNGNVVERYPPTTSPLQIEKDVQKLLAA